ncbi:transporter [Thalassobaculum fulvum]|uniref:Transporter n=1 Tax=Thalassobaculum fulvum TaxID=1633335 RepID=A0A918XS25_9PROT|nr:zinc transporter ZntB [Thalassobaculum fulvum]GHD49283.1 transporter [Thalassobaculum fulvum]
MAQERPGSGLIFGIRLDGRGGSVPVEGDTSAGPLWLHLERHDPAVQAWLATDAGVPPAVARALLEEDTRPRCVVRPDGILLILRGINFDPAAQHEETIAVRLWVEPGRLLSLRRYRVMAVNDLKESLERGEGPGTVADLVLRIVERLTARMIPEIDGMEEDLGALEVASLGDGSAVDRGRLGEIRRRALVLHRYLAPQREALVEFRRTGGERLAELDPMDFQETIDRVTRLVEDLDALRSRAAIVEDGLALKAAERMNRNMYWLSIVATVFLPIGFVTGLLGVNVGGIPGAESPWGFAALVGLLAGLIAIEVWIMRRARLI